jgi:hypothetical protein
MSRCCYPCPTVSEAQVVRVLLSHCCGWPADCAAVYTWASPCCGRTTVLYKLALRRPLQLALFASRPCPHCCSTPRPEHTEWHCRNIVTHSAVSGDSVPWATVTVWQNCWPQRQLCCSPARRPSPFRPVHVTGRSVVHYPACPVGPGAHGGTYTPALSVHVIARTALHVRQLSLSVEADGKGRVPVLPRPGAPFTPH